MTVTSFVPRSRASRRRPLRRLAATGALLALLLGGAVPALAATTPDPTETTSTSAPALTLVPAANGVVQPGSDLAVSVSLTSGGAAATASLAIGAQPLDRRSLSAWIAGDRDGVAVTEVGTAPLDASGTAGTATAAIRVVATDPALAGRPAGVYPILASTILNGVALTSTSAVVIPGPPTGARVGVVVPITAPAGSRGLLTSDALAVLTAADGELTAQLDAVSGTAAILAVDPAVAAAIRVLGEAAPVTARAWLDRLLGLPNSRFALQFADADLSTQIQAGLAQPLSPLPLTSYLPSGTVAPSGEPTATASATPDPSPTTLLPDLASLTDIGDARAGLYWPVGGTAGAAVVGALGATGTPGTPALTLVPSTTTSTGADGTRIGARVDSPASALLAYDTIISDLLRSAADAPDATTRDAALAAVTAQLALVDASTPLLVTVDRGQDRSRADLRAAIDAAVAPGTVAVDLTEIAAAPASAAVDVLDVPADAPRVADLTALLSEEAGVATFATILDDPELLTGRERAEILQLLGAGWRADAAAAQAAVAEHRTATVVTLGSVGILASDVNLLSYGADYRPYVRNDLPWPVNVTLMAEPKDPRLVMQTRTDAQSLPPDSNTRVVVPVEAKIANGQVTVDMRLISPTGVSIGAPLSIAVEVHADWENIGLGILGGLLVVFLGLGIVRTVLRRRATKRAAPEPEAETTA